MDYPDLSNWDLLSDSGSQVLAVGWLAAPEQPPAGLDRELFRALIALLRDPWQPAIALGRHTCALCPYSGGPSSLEFEGSRVELGRSNLFVPGKGVAYVTPSTLVHYVDAHGYRPPEEFRSAVLACPPMRSIEYLKRIRELGLHKLRRVQP